MTAMALSTRLRARYGEACASYLERPMTQTSSRRFRQSLTVLICEDELSYRQMLERELQAAKITVIACAEPEEAVEAVRLRAPDVALVDLYYDGRPWFDAAKQLRAVSPSTKVVALTSSTDSEDGRQAMIPPSEDAAFDGYLRKRMDVEKIVESVREAGGATPLDPWMNRQLLAPREIELDAVEVRFLVAKNSGLKGLALREAMPRSHGRLLSDRQIRRYAKRIRDKFGVRTTEQALVEAVKRKLIR